MSTRLLLCALLLCTSTFAQTTNAFRVSYNQALFDLPGNAIEALTPSNYVFAGTNMNFLPIYGTITQVDDLGALVWSKRYSDASIGFQINDIKKDPILNEYYVCGGSESGAAVFMRVDATGAVVVSKKFSISEADGAYLNRVIKTSDGGYVAVGYVNGHDPDGVGAEIKFSPITYIDNNGDSQTDYIGSPLIVKFDANGNHVWHHVFRYYTAVTKTPAQRIYNDASLNDIVEVADGYIAVGQYDVNNHRSNTNSDGDDATSNDALIIKTSLAGAITYHKQVDTPNTSATATSKYLSAISKTSIGDPIAAGSDNGKELIMKYGANGGFSLTFSRDFTYSTFFGTPDPVDVSQIYEVDGGTDLVTMAMYIKPLSFTFANSIHRVNPTATTNTWSKYYTFSLATILPRGGKTSDGGYIMNSTVMGGANFDYHLIKTDPTGETPITGCAAVPFTPSASAGPTTIADPYSNNWSGTVGPQTLTVTATAVTPTATVQCTFTACTAPAAPVIGTITQPTCSVATGSVALSGLPATGTWTVTASPGGATTTGTGTTGNFTGLTAGTTYTFTVTNAGGCTSVASSNAVINAQPTIPTAPVIGTITQPTCSVATGSIALSGLPASGSWIVTASPGGTTISGSGTTGTFTGLTPGTYTFTVATSAGVSTLFSEDFETGGPGWTLNVATGLEGADANFFQINDDEGGVAPSGCGVANNNDETLHITSVFNPSGGAAYDAGGLCGILFCPLANKRAESPVINSVGQSGLTLNFSYIAKGNIPNDQATVWYNDGTGWYQLGAALNSPLCGSGQGQWSAYSSALPTSCNNIANLKIAIRWVNNDDGVGTDPSVAINNITITAAGAGCTSPASASATINTQPTSPTTPVIGTITQPTCSVPTGAVAISGLPASGSWTVTASPGGATITGSGTTGNFTGLTAGTTYTFTVTNAAGCTSVASSNAAVTTAPGTPSAPIVGTITQPTCSVSTGSVALSGLPSGSWTVTASPGGTTITGSGTTGNFTGLTAGTTYTFTVTNAAGCTSIASSNAALNAQPATPTAPVIGTITQPTCSVATGSVALSGLPASGSWTVTASPGGTTITGSGTTGNFTGLTAGTTYNFTVTNVAGCTSAASANAAINTQPTTPTGPVIGTITQPTCSVPTGTVALSGLPATGTWTVTASPGGATITGTGTTGNFTGLTAGTTYTFTVTNAGGCASVASTNAVINTQPVTPSSPIVGTITQPTCSVSTGSVALSGLPATGTWTVTASPSGATITGTGTTGNFTGLTSGTTYTFTVTNSSGCTSVASTSAVIDVVAGAPIITLDTQQNVNCNGGTTGAITIIVSSGQAPYTYQWTPNVGSGATVSNLTAGSYTVLITDDLGCTATATYTISQGSSILIDETIENVICETSLGSILTSVSGGTGPYSYLWTPNGEVTTGLIDLSSGNYGVTVTDNLGCVVTENYTVGFTGSLTIDADPNYSSIDEGESVQLTVTGGTNYTWTPSTGLSCTDCSNPVATPTETTTYFVTSTDASGCTGGDTVLIEIKIHCGDLYVPNIFSPNGDMNNDYLCIYGSCIRELKYAVYDRWGEKVFETEFTVNLDTKNYDEVCWDGTFRGKPLNTGVYAYKIYAELDNGDILEESGNITLVK